MDLLDRVAGPGTELLEDVDRVLSGAGAPADHRIWSLIHRAGALPGAAFASVLSLAADDVRASGEELVAVGAAVTRAVESVPARLDSRGAAADGFSARWNALAPEIGDDGLAGRITGTAAALDSVASWVVASRRSIAGEVGACLGSHEAVLVRTGSASPTPVEISAAADIGACVLEAVMAVIDDGWQRIVTWGRLTAAVPTGSRTWSVLPASHHIDLR